MKQILSQSLKKNENRVPRLRFTDTTLERFTKALGYAYRFVTLMTTSTMHTNNHLSGMSNVNPCAKMSSEISEVI